jgi:hypothetical protein
MFCEILVLFFDQLTDEENSYMHFMQDNAMVTTGNNSIDTLNCLQ